MCQLAMLLEIEIPTPSKSIFSQFGWFYFPFIIIYISFTINFNGSICSWTSELQDMYTLFSYSLIWTLLSFAERHENATFQVSSSSMSEMEEVLWFKRGKEISQIQAHYKVKLQTLSEYINRYRHKLWWMCTDHWGCWACTMEKNSFHLNIYKVFNVF